MQVCLTDSTQPVMLFLENQFSHLFGIIKEPNSDLKSTGYTFVSLSFYRTFPPTHCGRGHSAHGISLNILSVPPMSSCLSSPDPINSDGRKSLPASSTSSYQHARNCPGTVPTWEMEIIAKDFLAFHSLILYQLLFNLIKISFSLIYHFTPVYHSFPAYSLDSRTDDFIIFFPIPQIILLAFFPAKLQIWISVMCFLLHSSA